MANAKNRKLVQTALLTAIIVIMAFTPLGYFKTAGVEITFIMIPVVIGAIMLGPSAGALLGGIFGITSFIQCFGMSAFGVALFNVNPIYTFIVCVIPRILAGYLCGVIFKVISKRDKTKIVSFGVASLMGPILNTILFMCSLVLFFYNTDYIQSIAQAIKTTNPFSFVVMFVGINGLIETIVCFILSTAITKPLSKYIIKN